MPRRSCGVLAVKLPVKLRGWPQVAATKGPLAPTRPGPNELLLVLQVATVNRVKTIASRAWKVEDHVETRWSRGGMRIGATSPMAGRFGQAQAMFVFKSPFHVETYDRAASTARTRISS